MSDDVDDEFATGDPDTPASEEPAADDTDDPAAAGDDRRELRRYLDLAAVAVLALLALVATLRFYLAASATIDTWVAPEYRSLFQAAFNLAVLLAAVGGLALQLRRVDR